MYRDPVFQGGVRVCVSKELGEVDPDLAPHLRLRQGRRRLRTHPSPRCCASCHRRTLPLALHASRLPTAHHLTDLEPQQRAPGGAAGRILWGTTLGECAGQMPRLASARQGEPFLYTLSPAIAKCLTGCLIYWRRNLQCTVLFVRQFFFCISLLELVLDM
jgi:hypothetical protein